MSEIEKLENELKSLDEGLEDIQKVLNPVLNKKGMETINEQISLMEQAKLSASMAYCLNSLYFVYMRLNGIPLENHKINQENERLKNYFNKIQNSSPNTEEKKPIASVNKEALSRIISSQTREKKEDIRKIEKEVKDWDIIENKNNPISKKKEKQKLLKGALLPSGKHLTWKDELEKMLK